MFDIIAELLSFFIILILFASLVGKHAGSNPKPKGWRCLLAGMILLLLGAALDLTETFRIWPILLEGTNTHTFFKRIICYFGGFLFLTIGIWRWITFVQENEARFKNILDAVPVGVFVINTENRAVVDVNPAALQMTGYSRQELLSCQCCLQLCPGRYGNCPVMDHGAPNFNGEVRITRKDGSQVPVQKTVTRFSLDGTPHLLETFVDITKQKRLERLKEDIDRIIHHDLRAPVSSIINAADLALMETALSEESREMLSIIKTRSFKMLDMIGLSMALDKMESETFEYLPETLDLCHIVRRTVTELADSFPDAKTQIQISIDHQPFSETSSLFMTGQLPLLQSMLSNLLTNAIEASQSDHPIYLEITSGESITIAITNNGAVPTEMRTDFFKKYATAGKSHGTGLGTYSAALITRTLGGDISMNSSEEKDETTVTVRLPSKTADTPFA